MFVTGEGTLGKGTLEGTCTLMCPEAETAFRDRMRDIDSFEKISEGGPPILAVKKFARNVSPSQTSASNVHLLSAVPHSLLMGLGMATRAARPPDYITGTQHCLLSGVCLSSLLHALKCFFKVINDLVAFLCFLNGRP